MTAGPRSPGTGPSACAVPSPPALSEEFDSRSRRSASADRSCRNAIASARRSGGIAASMRPEGGRPFAGRTLPIRDSRRARRRCVRDPESLLKEPLLPTIESVGRRFKRPAPQRHAEPAGRSEKRRPELAQRRCSRRRRGHQQHRQRQADRTPNRPRARLSHRHRPVSPNSASRRSGPRPEGRNPGSAAAARPGGEESLPAAANHTACFFL